MRKGKVKGEGDLRLSFTDGLSQSPRACDGILVSCALLGRATLTLELPLALPAST